MVRTSSSAPMANRITPAIIGRYRYAYASRAIATRGRPWAECSAIRAAGPIMSKCAHHSAAVNRMPIMAAGMAGQVTGLPSRLPPTPTEITDSPSAMMRIRS